MDASALQFDIRPSSGAPIYRQIIDQVHALVAGGRLQAGDLLPSVRQVAKAADVNPMTVSKAYSRLEAQGFVERVRGQGMRVADAAVESTLAARKARLKELLAPAVHRAVQLGLSGEEFRQVLNDLLKELEYAGSEK